MEIRMKSAAPLLKKTCKNALKRIEDKLARAAEDAR